MTPATAIRFAMMAGVLLFGGAAWFIHRTPEWTGVDAAMMDSLLVVARVIWALCLAGLAVLFWRARTRLDRSPAQLGTIAVLAWALGETLALYGGVVYYMSARPAWYVAGVLVLALAFVAFPGRQSA